MPLGPPVTTDEDMEGIVQRRIIRAAFTHGGGSSCAGRLGLPRRIFPDGAFPPGGGLPTAPPERARSPGYPTSCLRMQAAAVVSRFEFSPRRKEKPFFLLKEKETKKAFPI